MPQVCKIGGYMVYFWTNEGRPLEPLHVHFTKGTPSPDDTKVWITRAGGCLLCHNKGDIPQRILRQLMRIVEARSVAVEMKWQQIFGDVSYYC